MGNKEKVQVKPAVMSITVILFVAMLVAIVINAEGFYYVLNNLVMNNLMNGLGWAVSLVILFMVILCVVIMVTYNKTISKGVVLLLLLPSKLVIQQE